jgi:subtilase family serine protease
MPGERRARGRGSNWFENLENRRLLSAAASTVMQPELVMAPAVSSTTPYGYTPAQIEKAYGISTGASSDGAGQTIAIIDAYNDPDISSDLASFDKQFGLGAPPSLKVVNQSGGSSLPANNASWDLEISLDVEWAHAIAPDASILLVEASSATLGNLLNAVNYARDASGVSVVSMSWGSTEFSSETSYDGYFTTPSGHEGVTFVAASGDEGGFYGPLWPAISPNVVSVGGTTLTLNSSGGYGSETAWSDSTGGVSEYEPEPSYQDIAQGEGRATAPDVAWDANPSTGMAVYDSVSYSGQSGWFEVGGTSAGAPAWSGLIADADQGRAAKGLGTLTSAGTLSTLFSTYSNSSTYNADFHDVTSGNNGVWRATVGYDAVTGLGSPKGTAIVSALVGASGSASQAAQVAGASTSRSGGAAFTIRNSQNGAAAGSAIAIAAAQHDSSGVAQSAGVISGIGWMPLISQAPSTGADANVIPSQALPAVGRIMSDADVAAVDAAAPTAPAGATSDVAAQSGAAAIKVGAVLANLARSGGTPRLAAASVASAALGREEYNSTMSRLAAMIGAGVLAGAYGVRAQRRKAAAAGKPPVHEGHIFTP